MHDVAVEAGMPDTVPDTVAVAVAVMALSIMAVDMNLDDTQSDVVGLEEMFHYSSRQLFLAMTVYSRLQKLRFAY